MELQPGREALVRVAAATLWTAPEAVRPVDRPALAPRTDIPAWVAGMDAEQRVGDCVLSQLLLGERALVTELRPDGWARVVAVEQPAPELDRRGYPGWLPTAQLTPAPPRSDSSARCTVAALTTDLREDAHGPVALAGATLGTRLPPAGPPVAGRLPLHTPGHADPLWAAEDDVAPLPEGHPDPADPLALARRLRDVPYVWGGLTPHGVDCSGLVHLAWRRYGVVLPRDAYDQAQATTPVRLGEERPGDLYFFARPGRRIHHVGIVTGERRMLHACYRQRRVVEEALPADRLATLVGAARV
ncbi:C40 family peptidase [Micromonospora siamensis]|uniref:Cell wall-associated hydrolase, NlpC family n=1 Tax=Micromonospora siamensis TaxID=299152 RepID=A0A1C5JES5_9ACTN|nr:NlpC/P60 family protein [Micromonospora siamensis]SCG69042.1 Cell wall-associated hydrolase, NlpC family [Micromonospora siamensis]